MKGDYVKEEKDNHSNTIMFAKLHQTQKFQQQQQHQHHNHPPPPPPPQQQQQQQQPPTTLLHHSFTATNPRECQTSEEVDSHRSPTTPASTTNKRNREPPTQTVHLQTPSSGNDGATIEVVRRPRGRPPGSKNKPKPPVIITREAEPSMSPYVLEIPGGIDILETITTFCRKRNTGLCILNGSGTVSNVTLRQPSTTPGASVTFHGRFDILSLSATILPPNNNPHPSSTAAAAAMSNGIANGFTISLAGPQGQVVGGTVMGSLFTAGTVFLIAASFNSPSFHRLPLEDERNSGSAAVGGGSEGRHQSPPTVSGGADDGGGGGGGGGGVDSCGGGVSLYSCHLPSDVIWAPAARQPQHPPPY